MTKNYGDVLRLHRHLLVADDERDKELQAPEHFATDIFWLQTLNVTKNYSKVRPRFFLPWWPLGLSAERGS